MAPPGSATDPDWERARPNNTSDYGSEGGTSGFTLVGPDSMHIYEHGRRYQAFLLGRYPLPNDEREQGREALKHYLVTSILGGDKLFMSPIGDRPRKIADMGCGRGYWTIDVADRYPSARVIGVDLSNMQPTFIPPNAEFRMDDVESEWVRLYANLDFVHLRSLTKSLRNLDRVIESAFKNLVPGGWIEFQDFHFPAPNEDSSPSIGHPLRKLIDHLSHAYSTIWGWDFFIATKLPSMLAEAGFHPVHVLQQPLHVAGPLPPTEKERRMGIMARICVEDGVSAYLSKYDAIGMTFQEAEKLERDVERALNFNPEPVVITSYSVWAQKPY